MNWRNWQGNYYSMHVEIDSLSGFCFGVVSAIRQAEQQLEYDEQLYCLGDIVHNESEIKRLESLGLKIISYDDFQNLHDCKVLLRAHGEPPATYAIAKKNNIELIDATCLIVLQLQKRIKKSYEELKSLGGQIAIFGKKNHAEVIGLVGQTEQTAVVISHLEDLNMLDFYRPIRLYAQTTMGQDDYSKIAQAIEDRLNVSAKEKFENEHNLPFFISYQTLCKQVAGRAEQMDVFAKRFDVVLFVSSKESSNGRYLYELCKQANPQTYFITGVDDLKNVNFENVKTVGICGATSTPMWLMEEIAGNVRQINNEKV